MCEQLLVRFSKGRCQTKLCVDNNLTPRIRPCAAPRTAGCKISSTAILVPVHCNRHREKAIKRSIEDYYQNLKNYKTQHPETRSTVTKRKHLHKDVGERVRNYPDMLEQRYNQKHEAAVQEFCSSYIRTGRLPQPTQYNYEFVNTFMDDLALAMREYNYAVIFDEPPTEQPESVLAIFWKDDNPLLAMLEVSVPGAGVS